MTGERKSFWIVLYPDGESYSVHDFHDEAVETGKRCNENREAAISRQLVGRYSVIEVQEVGK